jgi:RimJ/RimL family protein N-acetyltransferase
MDLSPEIWFDSKLQQPTFTQIITEWGEWVFNVLQQSWKLEMKVLEQKDVHIVFDFFQNSTWNHWPFAWVITSKCGTPEKVYHELWPWSDLNKDHNLYFWMFFQLPNTEESLMIWGLVVWISPVSKSAEIGIILRDGYGNLGLWTFFTHRAIDFFLTNHFYREKVLKLIATVPNPNNIWIIRMLGKCGFQYKRPSSEGAIYVREM